VNIAILDDYQRVALQYADWKGFPACTRVQVFDNHIADIDALAQRLEPFEIVVAMRERTPFPRRMLERLPNLQLLVTTGMRNASIDTPAATDLGILVCGTRSGGPTTAELAWGLILGLCRHIPQEFESVKRGGWETTVGTEVRGKTLGLLGLGNLGSSVAIIGKAFGMNLIAWSQNLTAERAHQFGATLVGKEELFTRSDFISIHLVLSDRTRGLVGQRELALMKPSAYLINTSRGPIVDEKALLKTLQEHKIAGAGLDVFEPEPLPSGHPFLDLDNVLLTPHLGYVTQEGYRIMYPDTVEDIKAYLAGKPVRVFNPEVIGKNRGIKASKG
jgi:phosphoglycerate dehydrogenase-like enzyme